MQTTVPNQFNVFRNEDIEFIARVTRHGLEDLKKIITSPRSGHMRTRGTPVISVQNNDVLKLKDNSNNERYRIIVTYANLADGYGNNPASFMFQIGATQSIVKKEDRSLKVTYSSDQRFQVKVNPELFEIMLPRLITACGSPKKAETVCGIIMGYIADPSSNVTKMFTFMEAVSILSDVAYKLEKSEQVNGDDFFLSHLSKERSKSLLDRSDTTRPSASKKKNQSRSPNSSYLNLTAAPEFRLPEPSSQPWAEMNQQEVRKPVQLPSDIEPAKPNVEFMQQSHTSVSESSNVPHLRVASNTKHGKGANKKNEKSKNVSFAHLNSSYSPPNHQAPPPNHQAPYPNPSYQYPNHQAPFPNPPYPYPNPSYPYPNHQAPFPNPSYPYPNPSYPYPNHQAPFPNHQAPPSLPSQTTQSSPVPAPVSQDQLQQLQKTMQQEMQKNIQDALNSQMLQMQLMFKQALGQPQQPDANNPQQPVGQPQQPAGQPQQPGPNNPQQPDPNNP